MPLEIVFEEKYPDSRSLSITQRNTEQTVVGHIKGDFFSEATENAAGLWNDDVVMIEYLYARLPLFFGFPTYNGQTIILVIQDLQINQINDDVWKFTIKYGIPNNGGVSGGGLGTADIGQQGPDPNRQYSDNFTQVSFNVTSEKRTRNMSLRLLASQKNVAIGGNVPFEIGKAAPIGFTQDGITGAEVYERQFSFNITSYFEPSKLTYEYVRKLHNAAASLNDKPFFGFATESVLFLEASASGDLYQVVPVTFSFKVRNNFKFSQTQPLNIANANVQDPDARFDVYNDPFFPDTEVIQGWAEVDYTYRAKADPNAKMVLQEPVLRQIHQLYYVSNFDEFGL